MKCSMYVLDLGQDKKVKMEDFVRLLFNETNFPLIFLLIIGDKETCGDGK